MRNVWREHGPPTNRGILAGFSPHFLFNQPVFDFLEFSARENEGSHPVEEYSNSPTHKGPDKPEISGRGEEVDDDEQDIHPNIDSQMDVKSNLGLHPLPCRLVGLFVFHKSPLFDPIRCSDLLPQKTFKSRIILICGLEP